MASKSTADRTRAEALGKALRGMFKALEARPAPDRLRSVVDQLDEGEDVPATRKARSS
jgi:hypothetical protein